MKRQRTRILDMLPETTAVRPYKCATTARKILIRALASEYQNGNSQARLWVSMLVRTIVYQDLSLSWRFYDSLQLCGIAQSEVDEWVDQYWSPTEEATAGGAAGA